MKFSDIINILETIISGMNDPRYGRNTLEKSDIFDFINGTKLNSGMDKSINVDSEGNNKEYDESIFLEDSKSYNDNRSNDYCNKQKDVSSNSKGVIDSITHEITPVRLKQAIILSEIVGKPRSKTRNKRRV